mmetsp:Transcript_27237/g.45371  ORF Transcript_27237/g.45371 Transcript_27237/m.45371 type:complete len:200 (+) Transcript_27237:1208-1807(+)
MSDAAALAPSSALLFEVGSSGSGSAAVSPFPGVLPSPSLCRSFSSATEAATERHSDASCRSSSRTPASIVYPLMSASIMWSFRSSCCARSPWRASCLRNKCLFAICTFSSTVYPCISITSIRSRSGLGISPSSLAVAIKRTRERLNGSAKKWSRKAWFCSGSRTSSNAEEGSPFRELRPSLSTSSSMMTALLEPHFLIA